MGGGLTLGGSAGNPALLNFNLETSSVDTVAASGGLTVNAGGAIIALTQLSGGTLAAGGPYNLLTFSSSLAPGSLTFAGGATTRAPHQRALNLQSHEHCRAIVGASHSASLPTRIGRVPRVRRGAH